MTRLSPHFSRAELACRATGEVALQPGFLGALEALRRSYARPMIVTSGCRSPAHNRAIGGHPRSLHMIGNPHHGTDCCAIDIARPDGAALADLIARALQQGWSLGIADTFVHLDQRTAAIGGVQRVYTY